MVTPAAVRTVIRFGRAYLRPVHFDGDFEERRVTSPNGRFWRLYQQHPPPATATDEWVDTVTSAANSWWPA